MKKWIKLALLAAVAGCLLAGCADAGRQTLYPLPTGPQAADITVEPISGLKKDFIRGMDVSSLLAQEASGVRYYGFDGVEQDALQTIAQAGVNTVRLRVWNDPFDTAGQGYGGGNCDLSAALVLGKRAAKYGLQVCVDFHYSDFWADPKRQHAPKDWQELAVEEKAQALYEYTADSLCALLDAGVDVTMVQVGNEINNGMAGETDPAAVMALLAAGSDAVRNTAAAYEKEIQIAVHYTDIHKDGEIARHAELLREYKVDYDIFAISYYPYWHGSLENMQDTVKMLRKKYRKQVVIAETAYCYTSRDGDGYGNSVKGTDDLADGYPASVQGQADMVRDICAAASEAGALGMFYWEGAWTPVSAGGYEANFPLWEQYGSGWASSHAADYDPQDAGLYYGGNSWDNQAMFDFYGRPLPSLQVFRLLRYGTTTAPEQSG